MARITKAIVNDGSMFIMAIDSTDMVEAAEKVHKTSAVCTAALGRLLTGASLLGSNLKGENETLTLRVDGDGPASPLVAVADSIGNVKGYLASPVVEIPLNSVGKLDVGGAVGRTGTMSVIKDLKMKEPSIGQVELQSGEIAEDLTYYLAQSEQVASACALGVLVNPDLSVWTAGGYIVQLLPGADEESISKLEENLAVLAPVTDLLKNEGTPETIIAHVFAGMEYEIMDSFEVFYQCDCQRERVENVLKSLGKKELQEMIDEKEPVEVHCDFCGKSYHFSMDDLEKLKETTHRS